MDKASAPLSFAELFHAVEHRQSVCVLAVLTWIASCDGRMAPAELELLRRVAIANQASTHLHAVIEAMRAARSEDLELACRYLRNHTDRAGKRLFAQLAITMAVQDGYLTVGENYLLQFLCDLLGFSPRAFGRMFEQVAHRPFPIAGDPSSIDWWRRREAGQRATAGFESAEETDGGVPNCAVPMSRTVALRLLGLEEGASRQAIHDRYRRLAKMRHPDRYAPLGPAAVTAASEAFKCLHEAYALLSS